MGLLWLILFLIFFILAFRCNLKHVGLSYSRLKKMYEYPDIVPDKTKPKKKAYFSKEKWGCFGLSLLSMLFLYILYKSVRGN